MVTNPVMGLGKLGDAQNATSKAGVRSDFWRSSGREEGREEGEEGVNSSGERNRTRERERERWISLLSSSRTGTYTRNRTLGEIYH